MPASEVMSLYRQHKLHSGPGGPVVKSKKQATAIQISMARKEGHHIPEPKGSFQHGGMVPETGDYQVHQGEEVTRAHQGKVIAARTRQGEENEWNAAMKPHAPYEVAGPPPTGDPHYAVEALKSTVADRMRAQGVKGSFDQGGAVKATGNYIAHTGEEVTPSNVDPITGPVPDVGGLTPELESEIGSAAQQAGKPKSKFSLSPGRGDNPYLKAMQSSVAAPLQRVQGFKHGGTIPRTGIYRLHQGEHVIPASLASQYRKAKHG